MYPKLAEQIGLKYPDLKEDEYEVRIWYRAGLLYGDSQTAYVLHKTEKRFTIVKYIIQSNQQGFQFAKRRKPKVTITPTLWQRFLRQNILTLPNESIVFDRLYPKPKPRPPIDTVGAGMQADGSFTVKGYKPERRRSLFTDGDGYSFELFGPSNYRVYHYSNPDAYLKDDPQCEELQNVVGILDDLSLLFRTDKIGREKAKVINEE
ncbi:hypothetical protein GCM10028810_34450 [Spirosoma litoris]